MVKRFSHLTDAHAAGVVERTNERFLGSWIASRLGNIESTAPARDRRCRPSRDEGSAREGEPTELSSQLAGRQEARSCRRAGEHGRAGSGGLDRERVPSGRPVEAPRAGVGCT
ncbi:MAG: hypothetical protein ACREF4_18135 [Gammaproteobacteria bacterium]